MIGTEPQSKTHVRFLLYVICVACMSPAAEGADAMRIATFSSDITIPLGHRCMGVLETKSKQIDDPLEAHGLVIQGSGQPILLVALDWCEVRNGAYDQWRQSLADAAGTSRKRVLVCSLHQHDAPVADRGAQTYLDSVGLQSELYDTDFHDLCIQNVVDAMKESLSKARPLTHVGFGEATVSDIASNRRVIHEDGTVRFDRSSRMNGDSPQSLADAGEIDPLLKSIVFFSDADPVAAISCYATHPMSHYGQGAVSGDFVAIARRRRQLDTPGTKQIYVTGCSGDVTAGKYNDGSPAMRGVLADRLYAAMKNAMNSATSQDSTDRTALEEIDFRCEELLLPFHEGEAFRREAMMEVLGNAAAAVEDRISAAMGLSSLDRVERAQPIDLPCIDFGKTKITLLPGEAFVRYQLMAQHIAQGANVVTIGYGECWPGYIPTEEAFDEGFGHSWRWVARGCESIIKTNLESVLRSN